MKKIISILFMICFFHIYVEAQKSSTPKTDNLEYYIQNKKIGLR